MRDGTPILKETKSEWIQVEAGQKLVKRFLRPTRIDGIECWKAKTKRPTSILIGNVQVWPPAPWDRNKDLLTYPLSPALDQSCYLTIEFETRTVFRFLCTEVR